MPTKKKRKLDAVFKLLARGHLEAKPLAATCDRKLCRDHQPVMRLN